MREPWGRFGVARTCKGRRRDRRRAHLLGCGLAVAIAAPTQALGQRAVSFQPRLSVTETLTNNAQMSANNPLKDAITQLTAGVGFQSSSGPLQGYLDYALSGFRYARNSELNTHQNALNANLGYAIVENRARVNVLGAITQTAISAFGARPGVSGLPASNLVESRVLSIAPSFNGPLGTAVQYKAGLNYTVSDAGSTGEGDSSATSAFVTLGPTSPGVVGWSVNMISSQTDFNLGRKSVDNRLLGTVDRKIDALDLTLNALAGVEATDLSSFDQARYWNYGIGGTWEPSPRTRVLATLSERFFGRAHGLTFEHREARTSWTFSDTRSLSATSTGTTVGGRGPTFDLYYAQFASIEPDPVKRTELVNVYLRTNGLSATTGADTGYLRSGQTVVRSQTASMAYRGVRSNAVLVLSRNVTVPIDGAPLPGNDFINTSNIVSESASVSLSHRLTPMTSANLIVRYNRSHGDQPDQYSAQREVNLQYVARLTERSNFSAGARRMLLKNPQSPYNEGAVFATYGIGF